VVSKRIEAAGAACGIVFPLGVFLLAGTFAARGAALGLFVVFIPFLAYLCSVLRQAEGEHGWLTPTAFAAGIAAITIKLGSIAPELAIHRYGIADGTALHNGLQGMADAATDVCLYGFGAMLAAVCAVALRTRILPRWLGYGAGLVAVALFANGAYNIYVHTGTVPALLLFLLWTLLAGIVLLRRTFQASTTVAGAYVPAAG
jgi:hypothetical protein